MKDKEECDICNELYPRDDIGSCCHCGVQMCPACSCNGSECYPCHDEEEEEE